MKKKHIDVSVGITRGFDTDEKTLPTTIREKLTVSLNNLVKEIETSGWSHKIYRTKNLIFPKTITRDMSSLYLFNADKEYGVVLSLDNDPIFRQKNITLYRVAERKNLLDAFSDTANKLYSEHL